MIQRNPRPTRGRKRPPHEEAPARTPGEAVFRLMRAEPPGSERKIKLIEHAARLLTAEARAGMWSD
ncbi:MAG: hypothetical protein ACM3YN_10070 [Parcubacteria group bacterium]